MALAEEAGTLAGDLAAIAIEHHRGEGDIRGEVRGACARAMG